MRNIVHNHAAFEPVDSLGYARPIVNASEGRGGWCMKSSFSQRGRVLQGDLLGPLIPNISGYESITGLPPFSFEACHSRLLDDSPFLPIINTHLLVEVVGAVSCDVWLWNLLNLGQELSCCLLDVPRNICGARMDSAREMVGPRLFELVRQRISSIESANV